MPDLQVSGIVALPKEEAFDVYVSQINTWWPRQGIFPFSFAPKETLPLHIQFKAQEGGRFYETFQNNQEFVIGKVLKWDPPNQLVYTWKDPTWEGETTITVSFSQNMQATEVILIQDGFAEAGVPDLPPFYEIGNRQTLAAYLAHCRAIHEMKAFQEPKH